MLNEREKPRIPELKPCRYCGGNAEILKRRFSYFEPRPPYSVRVVQDHNKGV